MRWSCRPCSGRTATSPARGRCADRRRTPRRPAQRPGWPASPACRRPARGRGRARAARGSPPASLIARRPGCRGRCCSPRRPERAWRGGTGRAAFSCGKFTRDRRWCAALCGLFSSRKKASSFSRKEAKSFCFRCRGPLRRARDSGAKVFWFFFSKKNRLPTLSGAPESSSPAGSARPKSRALCAPG